MDRWSEIDCHPQGFVLATHGNLKAPWVALRVGHPDWAGRQKKHRFAWLMWHRGRKWLQPMSASPATLQFAAEHPDIYAWVAERAAAREL